MADLLATAHTWRGGDGPYTLAPLAGLFLTLLLFRFVLRRPLTWATVAIALALGAVFATIGATYGYVLTIAAWAAAAFLIERLLRQSGPFGRNGSD
jgi:hypothetical protein